MLRRGGNGVNGAGLCVLRNVRRCVLDGRRLKIHFWFSSNLRFDIYIVWKLKLDFISSAVC